MESAELEVLKRSFMVQRQRFSHVNTQAIAVALSEAVSLHADTDHSTRAHYTSTRPNYQGIDHHGQNSAKSGASSDTTSIVSTATYGTANVVPGFNTRGNRTFNRVRDEHIYSRMLSNMIRDNTPARLRKMRRALRENATLNHRQEESTYTADVIGSLGYIALQQILRSFVPAIPEADYLALFDNLHPDNNKEIMCSSFYNRLRGPISDARVQSIDAVFQGLLKAEGRLV